MDLYPYRNKANGLVGLLTHEQAAVFADSLELVEDNPPATSPEAQAAAIADAAAQEAIRAAAEADSVAAQAAFTIPSNPKD